jgi:hypothetical protein
VICISYALKHIVIPTLISCLLWTKQNFNFCTPRSKSSVGVLTNKKRKKERKKENRGLSPRENYTDRVTVAWQRSCHQLLRRGGVVWSAQRIWSKSVWWWPRNYYGWDRFSFPYSSYLGGGGVGRNYSPVWHPQDYFCFEWLHRTCHLSHIIEASDFNGSVCRWRQWISQIPLSSKNKFIADNPHFCTSEIFDLHKLGFQGTLEEI